MLPTPCASADGKTTATYATMSGWEATLGGWTRVRYLLHVAAVAPAQREAALVEAAAYMQAHLWDADKLRSVRCEAGMPNEAAWDTWLATTAAHVHEAFHIVLDGDGLDDVDEHGKPLRDDDLLLLLSSSYIDLPFRIPDLDHCGEWELLLDTTDDHAQETVKSGEETTLKGRSVKLYRCQR